MVLHSSLGVLHFTFGKGRLLVEGDRCEKVVFTGQRRMVPLPPGMSPTSHEDETCWTM